MNQDNENKMFYSISEFADKIGASYRTVYDMVYSGQIKHKRFAKRVIRIPASELEVK